MTEKVNRKEDAVLRALGILLFATNKQLVSYTRYGDIDIVRRAVSGLLRKDLIVGEAKTESRPQGGSSEKIYSLSDTGKAYLKAEGWRITPKRRIDPTKNHSMFEKHMLMITDLMLLIKEYCDEWEGKVFQLEHEQFLKRNPVGKVIPDLWVGMELAGKRWHLWVEADRGTEREKEVWQEKINAICDAYDPACTRFGCDGFTVVVVTTTIERAKKLKGWTEEALAVWRKEYGQIFYFGVMEQTSGYFFRFPQWLVPFKEGEHALIP